MAKYHISEHKEDIITSFIVNIVWWLLGILISQLLLWLPMLSGIIKTIKNDTYKIPPLLSYWQGYHLLLYLR